MLHWAGWRGVLLCCVALDRPELNFVIRMLHSATLYVMLCCYAVLRSYVALCVLCCDVLCYVVLYCIFLFCFVL